MKTGYQVARLLAYVTGLVNQELLLKLEYLRAVCIENVRTQVSAGMRRWVRYSELPDPRSCFALIANLPGSGT